MKSKLLLILIALLLFPSICFAAMIGGGGGFPFLDQNASPDVAGEFLYDNTVTGLDDGAFCWYDDDEIQYFVSIDTLPTVDQSVLAWDSATQRFFNKELSGFTGTDTHVMFFDGANTPSGDSGMTYDKTTAVLTVVGGLNLGAAATVMAKFMDSSCPGSDKDVGNIEFAYVDGDDGAENADFFIRGTDGGTENTILLQYDQSTASWITTKKFNLGGGSLEIPNAADPDLTVIGQVSMDTDGANLTGDASIRAFDGTNQWLVARKLKTFTATIVKPQDMADAVRDACPIFENRTGMTFTITEISCASGTDNTTLNIEEVDADGQNNATVDAVEIATDGTGLFTQTETTITGATIEAGHRILIDFDDTDDPAWVQISISGFYNANVD